MHSLLLRCLVAAVFAAFASCARERVDPISAPTLTPMHVSTAPVQHEVAPALIDVPGTVHPAEHAIMAAKITGTIETLSVALGQSVQRGELLVHLAAPELTARLAQARAQLEQAEREEKRNRELAAAGADTADAARAAEEKLHGARAAVAEAEAMLAYTEIRAPYDGRIAQKYVYTGALATPGAPLLELERAAALQVGVAAPASLVNSLAIGAELPVQIFGVATPVTGRVAEIAAAADATTHTVLVKLDLGSPDPTWSGRAARVQLRGESAETLLAPASAVTRFGQMERVFVFTGGKARLRLVKTGAAHGDHIELLAGVAAGEPVVIAPPAALRDGQPIVVAP